MLLLLACAAAAAMLFLRYKLEGFRAYVEEQAAERIGVDFGAGEVEAFGLRGLRAQNFRMAIPVSGGARIEVEVPEALLYVDLADLFYGEFTVEQVALHDADIHITLPSAGLKMAGEGNSFLQQHMAFRIRGDDCALTVDGLPVGAPTVLGDFDFDLSHMSGSPDTLLRFSGDLDRQEARAVGGYLRFAGGDDFDLRLNAAILDAADLALVSENAAKRLGDAAFVPSLRVTGYPGSEIVFSLESTFQGVPLPPGLPLEGPLAGKLTALARYEHETQRLRVLTAQVDTDAAVARLDGYLLLAEEPAQLDLRVELDRLPLQELLDAAAGPEAFLGGEVAFEEPYKLGLRLTGSVEAPALRGELQAPGGKASFQRTFGDQQLEAELDLGLVMLSWDSGGSRPEGEINVAGGVVHGLPQDLTAENVTGVVRLGPEALRLDAVEARVAGSPVSARLRYPYSSGAAEFAVDGVIAPLEDSVFAQPVDKLRLSGALGVRCEGRLQDNHYLIDLDLDATPTQIAYDWWFLKPVGVGATATALNLDVLPRERITISGEAALDTTRLNATIDVARQKGAWRPVQARAKADSIDLASVGKCILVPYAISGEDATGGYYEWQRVAGGDRDSNVSAGARSPYVSFLPKGGETAIRVRDLKLDATMQRRSQALTTELVAEAAEADLPTIRGDWFLPLRQEDPKLDAQFPRQPHTLHYDVRADALTYPPWEGSAFSASGYNNADESMLKAYRAKVGDGVIHGDYRRQKADNFQALTAAWDGIPARYLLEHLRWPEILTGSTTGEIHYSLDKDDPNTLSGAGAFVVRDGEFAPEFIFEQLEDGMAGNITSLPPDLNFETLRAEVALDGDVVKTPTIALAAPGLDLAAAGQFVLSGDMDYEVTASISPETAQRIPVLRDNFNVEGHRVTQNDIELAFHIAGPVFNPQGRVAGLPGVGVTLVSGAGQVTSDALKALVAPGQILLDLFKIGGGIMGAAK